MKKKLFKREIILFMTEVSLPVNTFLEMKTFPSFIAHNACMYNFWGFLKSHFVLEPWLFTRIVRGKEKWIWWKQVFRHTRDLAL